MPYPCTPLSKPHVYGSRANNKDSNSCALAIKWTIGLKELAPITITIDNTEMSLYNTTQHDKNPAKIYCKFNSNVHKFDIYI